MREIAAPANVVDADLIADLHARIIGHFRRSAGDHWPQDTLVAGNILAAEGQHRRGVVAGTALWHSQHSRLMLFMHGREIAGGSRQGTRALSCRGRSSAP